MKKFTIAISLILMTMLIGLSAYSQHILCVDRDGSAYSTSFTDVWPKFQGALEANGYTYTYYEVLEPELSGPDATAMAEHDLVVFFTGETWSGGGTMHIDDEFNLLLYLSVSSGKLFLSAQDYLWDRYPDAGVFEPGDFPLDVLGLEEVSQDMWFVGYPDTMAVYGAPGSFADGMVFGIQDVYTTEKEGLWIDHMIQHKGTNALNFRVPGTDSIAAYQYETEVYRSIFSTISFGGIIDTNIRTEFMNKAVSWLLGTTGAMEITSKEKLDILVYPNPARDHVKIGMLDKMNEVKIFNNTGQVVYQKNVEDSKIDVNISSLKTGMYVVQARTAKGMATERFLKE